MKNFSKLKLLKVEKSKIKELPPDIGNCLNLIEISANENPISALPESLGNCIHLEELNLSHTSI